MKRLKLGQITVEQLKQARSVFEPNCPGVPLDEWTQVMDAVTDLVPGGLPMNYAAAVLDAAIVFRTTIDEMG